MTKKEYMKKLAYQLRRLPKEDFDKAMDYFEEYFEDAGIENEQKAIEDLGAPEEAASALILDLAQENAAKPPKTMKRRFSALWIAILALFAAPDCPASGTLYSGRDRICDPWNTCSRWRYLNLCTCRNGRKRTRHYRRDCDHPSDFWGRTGYDRSVSDADRLWNPGHIFHHITGSLDHHQTCRTARQTCEKRGKKT